MKRASIDLSLTLTLAAKTGGKLDLLQLDCQRMPWLNEDNRLPKLLKTALNYKKSPKQKIKPEKIREIARGEIKQLLSDEGIKVNPVVDTLHLKEHSANALRKFSVRQKDGWLELTKHEKVVKGESANVSEEDLDVLPPPLNFHPNPDERQLKLNLNLKKELWLKEIRLVSGRKTLAVEPVEKLLLKGKREVKIPCPAYGNYDLIANQEECTIKFVLGTGKGRMIAKKVSCRVHELPEKVESLFVDMGSTKTKMIRISTECDGSFSSEKFHDWFQGLNECKVAEEKGLPRHALSRNWQTEEFISRHGLSQIEKETLVAKNDEELAVWLGDSVSRLAAHFKELGDVVWSFPAMKENERDFDSISRQATEIAKTDMLGEVKLVREHEAIHLRFRHALRQLGEKGQSNREEWKGRQARNKQHDKAWKEYESKWFISKLFSSEPKTRHEEGPELDERFYDYIDIFSDKLKNYIIVDAGGLTLDVKCQFDEDEMGESFAAGSEVLTEEVRKLLASKRGKEVTVLEARKEKEETCRKGEKGNNSLAKKCEEVTKEIYAKPLEDIVKWVGQRLERSKKKTIPVILSGGGMENRFLTQMIRKAVKIPGLKETRFPIFDSLRIAQLLHEEPDLRKLGLNRFYLASVAFDSTGRTKPVVAWDVSAGLLEFFGDENS